MTHHLPAHITFESIDITIIDRGGRAWIAAANLARALGYQNARAITNIYSRHADEFKGGMTEVLNMSTKGFGAGDSPKPTRIFSPRDCHLIAMLARTERAKAFRRWVLDVLDHLAEPKTQLQLPALPDKTEDTAFENELKRAINQRAHSLSLRQFDNIRGELRRIVKKHGKGKTKEEILSMVRTIETTDSGFYILRRGDLRGMTSRCAASHMMSEAVMEYIHKLEAETGAELYGRYDPAEARG